MPKSVDFTGKSPNRVLYVPRNFSIGSAQHFYMFRATFLLLPRNFFYPIFCISTLSAGVFYTFRATFLYFQLLFSILFDGFLYAVGFSLLFLPILGAGLPVGVFAPVLYTYTLIL